MIRSDGPEESKKQAFVWGLPAVPSRAKGSEEGDGIAEGLLMTGKARVVSS